jgi:hypothetical protein
MTLKRSGLAALGTTVLGLVGHVLVARYFNEQTWARHQQNFDLLLWIQQTIQGEQEGPDRRLWQAVAQVGDHLARNEGGRLVVQHDADTATYALVLEPADLPSRVGPFSRGSVPGDDPWTVAAPSLTSGLIQLEEELIES